MFRDFRKFTVTKLVAFSCGFICIGFNLPVTHHEVAVLKVEADEGGVTVEEVAEVVVSDVP